MKEEKIQRKKERRLKKMKEEKIQRKKERRLKKMKEEKIQRKKERKKILYIWKIKKEEFLETSGKRKCSQFQC